MASLQDRLGRTYRALGHAAKAKALFTKALAIRRAQLGADHPDTLATMSQQALALKDPGELNEAIALFEQVRDCPAADARGRPSGHPRHRRTTWRWRTGWPEGERGLRPAGAGPRRPVKQLGPDHPQTIDALDDLSAVYVSVGKGHEAIALAQQVRDARVKEYGVDHPLAIAALNNLAIRYQAAGKMRQALALFEQARDGIVPRLGPDHPNTLMILDSLARMYRAFGRTAEAIPLAEQVRDRRVMTLGAYHPYTIHTLDNLGLAYQAAGKPTRPWPCSSRRRPASRSSSSFTQRPVGSSRTCVIAWNNRASPTRRTSGGGSGWRRRRKARAGIGCYAEELAEQGENLLLAEGTPTRNRSCASAWPSSRRSSPSRRKTFHAQSLLGDALLGQRKYRRGRAAPGPGYEGLKAREGQIPLCTPGTA